LALKNAVISSISESVITVSFISSATLRALMNHAFWISYFYNYYRKLFNYYISPGLTVLCCLPLIFMLLFLTLTSFEWRILIRTV
jgi:hypothetical protein